MTIIGFVSGELMGYELNSDMVLCARIIESPVSSECNTRNKAQNRNIFKTIMESKSRATTDVLKRTKWKKERGEATSEKLNYSTKLIKKKQKEKWVSFPVTFLENMTVLLVFLVSLGRRQKAHLWNLTMIHNHHIKNYNFPFFPALALFTCLNLRSR